MGIKELLPLLKEKRVIASINISELPKGTCAIDAYGWLHKGTYSVGVYLAANKETTGFVASLHFIFTSNLISDNN